MGFNDTLTPGCQVELCEQTTGAITRCRKLCSPLGMGAIESGMALGRNSVSESAYCYTTEKIKDNTTMEIPNESKRRTVLKTIGAGVVGGTVLTGTAAAHGGGGRDHRVPTWFEGQVWEMTARPPAGSEPTDDESHAPIWHIAPAAAGKTCPQIPAGLLDFSEMNNTGPFGDGWGSVAFDETASANPFTTLWHIHWVFEKGSQPYTPSDLVNVDQDDNPLIDTSTIKNATNVDIVPIPFVFNCPIRPADEEHSNYC